MNCLEALGWTSWFAQQVDPRDADLVPARVIEEQRGRYRIQGEQGVRQAELSGRLRHEAAEGGLLLPCVGDWVLARSSQDPSGVATLHRVLERRTQFSRKAPGEKTVRQTIAANVDTVFLVQSLNGNLNPRRLERYLALLWESGAEPVVVLSKADLCADPESAVTEIERVAPGANVHVASAVSEGGLDGLVPYLRPGHTVALVGSSGVGKSTIVNRLAGEERLAVQEIRDDDRGRHTTTSRQLVVLPNGGLLLDTPGMRTVLLWEGEEGLAQAFEDIEALARSCRFRDCSHEAEPGCAVREALERGALPADRLESYRKLQREVRHHARKADVMLRIAEQRRWRRIHLENRRRPDKRGRP